MRWRDRLADPQFRLDSHHQRVDEVASADRPVLGQSQDRRGDRSRRMNRGVGMGVVKIENMRTDPVQQRGMENVHTLAAAEQRRPARAAEWKQRRNGVVDGFVP
jgi:hypothetical protein